MLTAISNTTYGESRLRTAFCMERRFRAHLVWRHRLLFDSRFAVPARKPAGIATIYLSLEGTVETATATYTQPVAFVLAEDEFERKEASSPSFRTWGDPGVVLNIRVGVADVRAPIGLAHGPVPLAQATWDAMAALAEVTAVDGDVAAPLVAVLRALYTDGVLATDLANDLRSEGVIIRRLWKAVLPYYERLMIGSSMEDLGQTRGASLRQIGRETSMLTKMLPMFGGFRNTVVLLRLRLATLLLSSPSATLADVAGWVGYASVEAMTGGFRDAGLPPPSLVRAEARYPDP